MGSYWVLEFLKVAGICLLSYAIYFLCWVKYPPRVEVQQTARAKTDRESSLPR